jgi:hypothetical protein
MMETDMSDCATKPCPVCKSEKIEMTSDCFGVRGLLFGYHCSNCRLSSPRKWDMDEALKAWNDGPPPDSSIGRVVPG